MRFWHDLSPEQQDSLGRQLSTIDLDWVKRAGDDLRAGKAGFRFSGDLEAAEYIPMTDTPANKAKARAAGEDLLRQGKVAALVVAGGQGTRLGFDAPKGCFPICPISQNSLFQLHAESILAMGRRYGRPVPLYVMTSGATDALTQDYFVRNHFFGLDHDDVRFFVQPMLPALTADGRLVLEDRGCVLMSPNGHGGTLGALRDSGMLDDMERRGVEEVSYFQVDNPLIRQVDPLFVGYHRLAGAQMSSKAIPKRDPEEKLGAFGRQDGRVVIVEYSDLTKEQMYRRRPDGSLVFGLGSPAMHVISVAFVKRMTGGDLALPFHVAEKAQPVVDDSGDVVQPQGKNIRKFETFIFDALRFAGASIIMEVRREDEFSPVKNATGEDSPATARRDMITRWAGWLSAAGFAVPRAANGQVSAEIEISPLYALDAQDLRARMPDGRPADGQLYLA